MRIIILTSSNSRSGGTRQAMYQAKGLSDRGHDVTLCLPADSSFWELPAEPFWYALPQDRRSWRSALEGLFTAGPAIVHAFHNKAVKLLAWWGLFWRSRGIACVAHRGVLYRPHNPLPYLSPAMRLFLVNSEACAKAISIYTPRRKIRIVPNAVPDARVTPTTPAATIRRQLKLPAGALCFAYVGNNTAIKGASELLQAFADAHLPQVELVMIGTDPQRWTPVGEKLGIASHVHHVGQVENVCDYLQIADAFVFPTNLDSAPNTLLEAVRMGLPVVATDVGGVPEIAKNNGILVPPKNREALTQALVRMAADADSRVIWAAASRTIGQRYTVEARCRALETIYSSLLQKN